MALQFPWGKQSCRCGDDDVMALKMGNISGMAQWALLRERRVTGIEAMQGQGQTLRWQDVGPQAEGG